MRSLALVAAALLVACSAQAPAEIPAADEPATNEPEVGQAKGGGETDDDSPNDEPAGEAPGQGATAGACAPLNVCDAPALDFQTRGFAHSTSSLIAKLGDAHHRVRDMLYAVGSPQRIHAKFTYAANDKDLHGETIELFAQRECGKAWEKLGEAKTTEDGEHPTVDGVEDNGGRIYFDVPAGKELGLGRHRIRAVVQGDGTFADGFIDVVPKGTNVVVSDIDGTLTSSEFAEAADLLTGSISETHRGAPEAFQALAKKGYRFLYLTARPEILTGRSREFIAKRGFPPGLVRTSVSSTGELGGAAAAYKTTELGLIKAQGLVASFGFGNKTSDSDAYKTAVTNEKQRIFFQIDEDFVGRRIESYTELVKGFEKLGAVCN